MLIIDKIKKKFFPMQLKMVQMEFLGFLDECNLKTYGQKIEEYLLSLKVIANTEKDEDVKIAQ